MEKLDLLVRFWELRLRYEALGMPLNRQERLELLSLLQLMASDGRSASARRHRQFTARRTRPNDGWVGLSCRRAERSFV